MWGTPITQMLILGIICSVVSENINDRRPVTDGRWQQKQHVELRDISSQIRLLSFRVNGNGLLNSRAMNYFPNKTRLSQSTPIRNAALQTITRGVFDKIDSISDSIQRLSLNSNADIFTHGKRRYNSVTSHVRPVSNAELTKFPYNNVVKLSCGCTGTLITSLHVLTAAHCVHNGNTFKHKIEMLKVKVPHRIGYRIHYIIKISVPSAWLKTPALPEAMQGSYDYAIVQLHLPVSGRERFMPLALPTTKSLNEDYDFLAFFPKESSRMWRSHCPANKSFVLMRRNVDLRKCTSAFGNSGAAMFTNGRRDSNRIVGVLSNTILINSGGFYKHSLKFDSIMLLTPEKCADICTMIYPAGENMDVCKVVKRNYNHYRRKASNRILPFFG